MEECDRLPHAYAIGKHEGRDVSQTLDLAAIFIAYVLSYVDSISNGGFAEISGVFGYHACCSGPARSMK